MVDAPRYVPNDLIHHDLQIPSVEEEISEWAQRYKGRIADHPNPLARRIFLYSFGSAFFILLIYMNLKELFSSVLLILFNFYLLMYSLTDFLYICLIGCIFCQLALFCLFGQKIHEKSERIFIDLYLTKWYEMDVKDQKILLLIMKMSQKTLGLKAGGMYAIDSSMFVQVTKMCFSYATILYTFL
ncbi:odorant receptor 22c-like [Lutzomyia longipalpis]|uniref:odorant receptor 22c-like n=1 Tax=Lutzomyia longipalpis TaxID=7200 RepID=UPI0024838D25|nr:odorant receptor 22c-like [Lutzomyia longipalpis]